MRVNVFQEQIIMKYIYFIHMEDLYTSSHMLLRSFGLC